MGGRVGGVGVGAAAGDGSGRPYRALHAAGQGARPAAKQLMYVEYSTNS